MGAAQTTLDSFPPDSDSSTPMPFPNDPKERTRLAVAGMRAFVRLSELWNLNPAQQATLLGASSPDQCSMWLKGDVEGAGVELLERLSYLLGIYKALKMLGAGMDGGRLWLRGPNRSATFDGGSPLDRMLHGDVRDLAAVREYLDAQFEWG